MLVLFTDPPFEGFGFRWPYGPLGFGGKLVDGDKVGATGASVCRSVSRHK